MERYLGSVPKNQQQQGVLHARKVKAVDNFWNTRTYEYEDLMENSFFL